MLGSATSLLFFLLPLLVQDGDCTDLCSLNSTQSDTISQLLNVSASTLCQLSKNFTFTGNAGTVIFLWYPPTGGDPVPVTSQNASAVLNLSQAFKWIIHGWEDNGALPWVRQLAASLQKAESCNVISLDWSQTAALAYPLAAAASQAVGYVLADFITNLQTQVNDILSKTNVIGHSLGAQIGAFAAKKLFATFNTKIANLVGLDAAAPLFEPALAANRIDKTDAVFVQLIHTAIEYYGMKQAYGCKDSYFNGGILQPNCTSLGTVDLNDCNHRWSYIYYTISILNTQDYLACSNAATPSSVLCLGSTALVGYGATANSCGSYYINTDFQGNPL